MNRVKKQPLKETLIRIGGILQIVAPQIKK
jgi:hypothetical protein